MDMEYRKIKLMAENTARKLNREYRRLYEFIGNDDSFLHCLDLLTKAELDEIRKILDLKGISQMNKTKLKAILAEEIPKGVESLLLLCNKTELKLIKDLVKNNGRLPLTEKIEDDVLFVKKRGLCSSGISADDKAIVFIPAELLSPIEDTLNSLDFNKRYKTTFEIIKVINGILFYYGVLSVNELYYEVKKVLGKDIDYLDYHRVITNHDIEESSFIYEGILVYYIEVDEPEEILMEQDIRKDIPFYPLNLKKVLEASGEEYEEINKHDQKLIDYLEDSYDIGKKEALMEIQALKSMVRNLCNPGELVEYLQQYYEFPDFDELQKLLELIHGVYNNTRHWILKGHTPMEVRKEGEKPLSNQETRDEVKIGRNDACPCGSGKKFKRCCGK